MAAVAVDPAHVHAFADAEAFQAWLAGHHDRETEVWIRIYKVKSGAPSITPKEAIDVALCWGWIDAIRKSLDEVIHGRMRLGIMVYLSDVDVADFTELKTVLEATQGNLSVHLKKLEEAGYVAIAKSFVNNKPLTRVSITPAGRKAFSAYLEAIGALIGGKD